MKALRDLLFVLFPRFCAGCNKPLYTHEHVICTFCLMRLPRAKLTNTADNALERLFWGTAAPEMVTAFLKMSRKGMVHHCIHALKYNRRPEVGRKLGILFGEELRTSQRWPSIDLIVPVPLHPAKEKERGYNQSLHIAMGISESLRIPVSANLLTKRKYTHTQTKKSRSQRRDNVDNVFHINRNKLPPGCTSILLVDDVITTGATLEACILLLKKNTSCRIYAAALAVPTK